MKNLFYGIFFVLLDIKFLVTFDAQAPFYISNIIGYFLIILGAKTLKQNSLYFKKLWTLSVFSFIYNVIVLVISLTDLSSVLAPVFVNIPLLFAMILSLFFIVKAIEETEEKSKINILSKPLRQRFIWLSTAEVITYFVTYFFEASQIPLSILNWVLIIVFMVAFYQTKTKYYEN